MNSGKTVFAQLMSVIPEYEFDKCVSRYNGSRINSDLSMPVLFALINLRNFKSTDLLLSNKDTQLNWKLHGY